MKTQNVLIITFWGYSDALIQTYTLPYVRMIRNILSPESQINLVTMEADRKAAEMNESGIRWVPRSYHKFGLLALWSGVINLAYLTVLIYKYKIDTIHCWCTPAGVYGLLLKFTTGRKLIIDSFEPHAEPMLEGGVWKKYGLAFNLLFYLEKLQARYADVLIGCVDSMKLYTKTKYGVERNDMLWKPAAVDMDHFSLGKRKNPKLLKVLGLEGKIVGVYAGKFGGSYLEKEVFELIKAASEHWGDEFRFLLLSAHPKAEIAKWMAEVRLDEKYVIQEFVPHKEVPDYLGLGDFGIVPFKPVPSKRYGSPIKTGEYLAMGMPIIITKDISDDSEVVANESAGVILQLFNKEAYLKSTILISELIAEQNIVGRIRILGKSTKSFESANRIYDQVYT